jgi:hypothetical protein
VPSDQCASGVTIRLARRLDLDQAQRRSAAVHGAGSQAPVEGRQPARHRAGQGEKIGVGQVGGVQQP